MRTDNSTPKVVKLFREVFDSGFFPREMISAELEKRGTAVPSRSLIRALQRAVEQGHLKTAVSHDGGVRYYLADSPWAIAREALANEVRFEPLRALDAMREGNDSETLRRWTRGTSRPMKPFKLAGACATCGLRFGSTKVRRQHERTFHKPWTADARRGRALDKSRFRS